MSSLDAWLRPLDEAGKWQDGRGMDRLVSRHMDPHDMLTWHSEPVVMEAHPLEAEMKRLIRTPCSISPDLWAAWLESHQAVAAHVDSYYGARAPRHMDFLLAEAAKELQRGVDEALRRLQAAMRCAQTEDEKAQAPTADAVAGARAALDGATEEHWPCSPHLLRPEREQAERLAQAVAELRELLARATSLQAGAPVS